MATQNIQEPDSAVVVSDEEAATVARLLAGVAAFNLKQFGTEKPAQKQIDAKAVDADVDLIYAQAVGNRSLEYTTAEVQAQAYKTAGYTGAVPPSVASWVAASGLTATAAADNILAQAVAWRGAVEAIRANRLLAKKRIADNVPTAMAQWNGFVAAIRGQLGL